MENWIFTGTSISKETKNMHIYYRKVFTVLEQGDTYILKITADDYYKLYINGMFVASGPASSYHFAYNYNRLDVSEYIVPGENIIAVHCYYQGEVNYSHTSGDNRFGMWARLTCDEKFVLETDQSWRWMRPKHFLPSTEPVGYKTQFMENVDMRKFEDGWNRLEYDQSSWDYAVINHDDDHVLTNQLTPTVDVYELSPEKVIALSDDRFILDFGKEICAGIKVETCGKCGSEIHLRFGEELDEFGKVRYDMRCNVKYEEKIVLSGRHDLFENYDYKGFRYLEVECSDNRVKPHCFSAMARHYRVKDRLVFKTKDSKLAQIAEICENAVTIGSQEGFLDCPTREKGQYLGDMTVTAIAHTYVTGDYRLYKKALVDFANSLEICPGMSAVAPATRCHNIADFSLLYPMQLLKYYHFTGDRDFLKKMLIPAQETVDYFRQYERSDRLLEAVDTKWNLVDWPDNLRDDYDFELSIPIGQGCHNVINAHYYGAMKHMNEIRSILGLEPSYDTESLRNAYMKEFYNPDTGLFTDTKKSNHSSLHSNVLPMLFEIPDASKTKRILDWMEIKDFTCGVFFAYFVLKTFVKYGRYQQAYRMIVSEKTHSWMNMIREGSTACFEAWGKDQKWNTSLCHPWGSAPLIILIEDFAGVNYKDGKPKIVQLANTDFKSRLEMRLNNYCLKINF